MSLRELPSLRFSGPSAGSLETRCAQTVDAAYPQLHRGFQRLEANLSLRHAISLCIGPGLRGLAERSMDGAAGNPPRLAPHESRSLPTANLRSGRFVRAPARWVAAGVPWSEGSPRSPNVTGMENAQTSFPPVGHGQRGISYHTFRKRAPIPLTKVRASNNLWLPVERRLRRELYILGGSYALLFSQWNSDLL